MVYPVDWTLLLCPTFRVWVSSPVRRAANTHHLLSAGRFESFVELNASLGYVAIERHGKEDVFRNSLVAKSPRVLESETLVVRRMPYKAAAPGAKPF